ncbi:MAG: ATP-dependent DNA helicase RecG [Clostridiales bacterium]|nr:ATP-dependent DNA helicase RecG [Clostridiales bacterium]
MDLTTDVRYLKGVGEKKAKLFYKLGLFTIGDLLTYFPRSYEDRSSIKKIHELEPDTSVCIEGCLVSAPRLTQVRQQLSIIRFQVSDGTDLLDVTCFNQPWLKNKLETGVKYVFFGKVTGNLIRREMVNPSIEPSDSPPRLTRRIKSIYRLRAGISQQMLSDTIEQCLRIVGDNIPDPLPESVKQKHQLAHARFAYENIHIPSSGYALETARRRLIFEELFILTLGLRLMRSAGTASGPDIKVPALDDFMRQLPFELTSAQERAIRDIFSDMSSGRSMNRLIQGDVGSGKTIVAAAAAWASVSNGYQCALMAPTEILATQHFEELEPLFGKFGFRTALLTGSMSAKQKREVKELIKSGFYHLIIGTHALITEDTEYSNLGLVITDEQHRFGVRQRAALTAKGEVPHTLVMSATPIPRTLALIMYGDLDVSVIDELPPGRKRVNTYAVDESKRDRIYNFIRRLVAEGRQVFIVCPLVEDPEGLDDGRKAVEAYTKQLSEEIFPDLRIGFVHGKLRQSDKDAVMKSFVEGKIDILVSTTVIEVGINVPNASLMIVENAERFGLSQLHQLRGRVGRGKHESYCILISDSKNEATLSRLSIMTNTNDGFVISEEDLKLRGPGDFFGDRQHGIPKLKIADLADNADTLREAAYAALELLNDDPELTSPENMKLRKAVFEMIDQFRS